MGEPAMVSESEDRTFKSRQHVEVRRFGRKSHGGGGERGLAIKSGAGEACASQKVGDGFQTKVLTQTSALRETHPNSRGEMLRSSQLFARGRQRAADLQSPHNLQAPPPPTGPMRIS